MKKKILMGLCNIYFFSNFDNFLNMVNVGNDE